MRELLRKLRLRQGQIRSKARKGVKKFGKHARAARKSYTPNPAISKKRATARLRDQPVRGSKGRRAIFMENDAISTSNAFRQMREINWCRLPNRCPDCDEILNHRLVEYRYRGRISQYTRCTHYGCRKKFYVMQYTPLKHLRLNLQQGLRLMKEYSRPDRIAPPSASKLAVDAGCGKTHAEAFAKLCRMAEAKKGEADNKKGSIAGDVEMDAHQVAKVYISPKNPFYQHLITDKHKKNKPSYFILYVQVAGAVQRG